LENNLDLKQNVKYNKYTGLSPGPGSYNPDEKSSSRFQSPRKNHFLVAARETLFDKKAKDSKSVPGPKYTIL
jgi:hypothetical protein